MNTYRINTYHPDTNKWDDAISTPHAYLTITVLVKLIVVGGLIRGSLKVTNKLLTSQSDQWEDYSQMPTAQDTVSVVSHQSIMIVMGGMDNDTHTFNTTELLYNTTDQWVKCKMIFLNNYIGSLQSVIVGDVLYTLGGANADDDASKAVYAAPLHALSNHQLEWQQLADTPWEGSAAVSVNSKYLLAVGGNGVHDTVCVLKREKDSIPTSTSWESIGTLPKVHRLTSAVSLGSQIIVIGGFNDGYSCHNIVTIGTFQ